MHGCRSRNLVNNRGLFEQCLPHLLVNTLSFLLILKWITDYHILLALLLCKESAPSISGINDYKIEKND